MEKRVLAIAIAIALCLSLTLTALAVGVDIFGSNVQSGWLKDYLSSEDIAKLKSGELVVTGDSVTVDLEKGTFTVNGNGSTALEVKNAAGAVIFRVDINVTGISLAVFADGEQPHTS